MESKNQWKRLCDESYEDFLLRICENKEFIGTWSDVADILNSELESNYTESKYRKDYYKLKNKDFRNLETDEISIKIRELEKQRIKLKTEKIEYNKWLREEARDEMIKDEIVSAINNLKPLKVPDCIKPEFNNKSYLLAFGDCHYGIEFELKDLFGSTINKYSPDIFKERMWDLLNQLIYLIEKENIKTLEVWEMGDSLQGILRINSQLMKLRYGIIESSILYADFLSEWLNKLSEYVYIRFQMVEDSNHNQLRILNTPKNSFPEENMSKVILTFIKERLKDNPNIKIIENPTGMNYTMVGCYNILGIHGEVKDLDKAIDEFSRIYQCHIDYICAGHLHHMVTKETGRNSEALNIRSIVGVDPYGLSLRKTSNAGASLFVFDSVFGKVCDYSLKVN